MSKRQSVSAMPKGLGLEEPVYAGTPRSSMGESMPRSLAEERELSEEVIARSKRILALVDDYAALQSSTNRTALRCALFDEFRAAAVRDKSVPAPASSF